MHTLVNEHVAKVVFVRFYTIISFVECASHLMSGRPKRLTQADLPGARRLDDATAAATLARYGLAAAPGGVAWGYGESLRICAQCGPVAEEVVMKVCSVCRAGRYCGAACQKLHWKKHKPECKRIKADNDAVAAERAAAALAE